MSNDENNMKRILDKLDVIDDRVNNVSNVLATQAVILEEHTRRSTTLEDEFKPIRASVLQIQGALKFLTIVSTIVAILLGLQNLLT